MFAFINPTIHDFSLNIFLSIRNITKKCCIQIHKKREIQKLKKHIIECILSKRLSFNTYFIESAPLEKNYEIMVLQH